MLRSTAKCPIRSRSTARYLCITAAGLIHHGLRYMCIGSRRPYTSQHIAARRHYTAMPAARRPYTSAQALYITFYERMHIYIAYYACACYNGHRNEQRRSSWPASLSLCHFFVFHSTCGKTPVDYDIPL